MKRTVQMMRAGVPGAANMKEWFHWKWGCPSSTTLKTRNAALLLQSLERKKAQLEARLIAKRNLNALYGKFGTAEPLQLPFHRRILLRVRLAFARLRGLFIKKG